MSDKIQKQIIENRQQMAEFYQQGQFDEAVSIIDNDDTAPLKTDNEHCIMSLLS